MKGSIPKVAWLLRFQIELRGAVASSNLRSVSARCVPVPPKQPHSALPRRAPDPSLSHVPLPFLPLSSFSATSHRATQAAVHSSREIESAIETEDQGRGPCSCHRRPRTAAPSHSDLLVHHPNNLLSVPCGLGQQLPGASGASGARVVSGDSGSASAGGRAWGWRRRV